MSKIAGLLLIVLGAAAAYVGYSEAYLNPNKQLSPMASYTTLALGGALILAGLAHFKAPHKAFLLSVALLLYVQFQAAMDISMMFGGYMWTTQAGLLMISVLILVLSYLGYRAKKAASLARA